MVGKALALKHGKITPHFISATLTMIFMVLYFPFLLAATDIL